MASADKKHVAPNMDAIADYGLSIMYPFALRAAILLNVPKIINSAAPGASLSAKEICAKLPNPERASSENLERILDILSNHDVFSVTVEDVGGMSVKKYSLTSSSQVLGEDDIHTAFLRMVTAPEMIKMWPRMHEVVLNPEASVFETVYGEWLYTYIEKKDVPELKDIQQKMFVSTSGGHLQFLLKNYDEEFKTLTGSLVDVGGNKGSIGALIASKYPNLHSVVNFDLPAVVKEAPASRGVEHVGGSFLDFVPHGDILIMKLVLLNWSDEEAVKILRNCRDALPATGKLILMEKVKIKSPEDQLVRERLAGQDLILVMMFKGAKLRSVEELRSIATAAGFVSLEVVDAIDTFYILELTK